MLNLCINNHSRLPTIPLPLPTPLVPGIQLIYATQLMVNLMKFVDLSMCYFVLFPSALLPGDSVSNSVLYQKRKQGFAFASCSHIDAKDDDDGLELPLPIKVFSINRQLRTDGGRSRLLLAFQFVLFLPATDRRLLIIQARSDQAGGVEAFKLSRCRASL